MNVLLTKSLPPATLAPFRSHGWNIDTVEALKITHVDVKELPDRSDVWIISSRNSLDVVLKFQEEAPGRILVVGKWLEGHLLSSLPGHEIKSFENMALLASELNRESFSSALYFCADNHREELGRGLTRHAGKTIPVITHESQLTFPVINNPYDSVFVFSPRSAESILRYNTFHSSVTFGCIGPTTEKYLHERGISNTFCSSYPDAGILLTEFYSSNEFAPSCEHNKK